jgi:hypothetical protein
MVTKNSNETVMAQSASQLMDDTPIPEFILLAGKDSTGKSSALVSLLWYLQQISPDVTGYVIDTENKFRSAVKSFGTDAPTNFMYYKCDNMNHVTYATAEIIKKHKPGDWLLCESLSRIWERAQDLAYNAIEGMDKVEYMERRGRKGSPIPQPDKFWNIAKGAHDGAFFDLLTQSIDLNCIFTAPLAKPQKEGFIKENVDRKAIRVELGIDANIEGAPRTPYYVQTLAMLDLKAGAVTCRILRDNNSTLEDARIEFPVSNRKSWALEFWTNCRS